MDDLDVSLMRGTLDLLILKALSWGPRHGYAVVEWIEQATDAALLVGEGTLYPALHRLERHGLVDAEWVSVPDVGKSDAARIATSTPVMRSGSLRSSDRARAGTGVGGPWTMRQDGAPVPASP